MNEAPQTPPEVVVKPVSAKEAAKVVQGKNTELQRFFANLPIGAVEAMSAAEIPQTTTDTVLISLFGDKNPAAITDLVLKPLCINLEAQMKTLQDNLKDGSTSINELNASVESAIMQTPGLADEFSKLSATDKTAVIKRVREMGVQAIGRRMFMEKAIVSTEATQYSTAKSKYDRIDAELAAKVAEQTTLKTAVGTTEDVATVTAHKQTAERNLNLLINQKESFEQQKQNIARSFNTQRNVHTKKQIDTATSKSPYDAAVGIASDQTLIDLQNQMNLLDTKIAGIDGAVLVTNTNLAIYEKQVSQLQRIAQLDTEMSTLKQQLTTVNTEMMTARGELIKRINQLTKDFNEVMPAASKVALETFKQRAEEANRDKTIDEAEKKATKAKEEGDMLALAEAEMVKGVELRYLTTETQRRMADFWQAREVTITDVGALRTEFDQIFNSAAGTGTADLSRTILNLTGTPPGAGSGLSQQTIDYLRKPSNAEAVNKLIERVRVPLFKSVAQKAVSHLDLDETSLRNIADSPDFIAGAEAAIAADARIGKVIDQVYGSKLGGSRNISETLRKMPAGGLIGIIMMLLGLGWKGMATAGKVV